MIDMAEHETSGNVTIQTDVEPDVMPRRLAEPLEVWWQYRRDSSFDGDPMLYRRINMPISAGGTVTWCDVGQWAVRFPVRDKDDIPVRDAVFLFAAGGRVFSSGRMQSVEVTPTPSGELACEVKGQTEEALLQDRLCYPDPTRWGEQQTTQSHDRRSGPASTVMIGYAQANTINGPPPYGPSRRILGHLQVAPDPVVGATISMSERWTNLLDALQRAALLGGVGFRVTRGMGENPVFEVTQPEDRSASAVFAIGRGTISDLTWRRTAPSATTVISAGTGELTARKVTVAYNDPPANYWDRTVEVFRDQRSEDDVSQLRSDGLARLAEGDEQETIAVTATPALTFGVHYSLGDLVRVVLESRDRWGAPVVLREIVDRVQQVKWRATATGVEFEPVIGPDGATVLVGGERALSRRLQQVEGAQ